MLSEFAVIIAGLAGRCRVIRVVTGLPQQKAIASIARA
jgi:hypothetical protein